jgi:hypothetical protein
VLASRARPFSIVAYTVNLSGIVRSFSLKVFPAPIEDRRDTFLILVGLLFRLYRVRLSTHCVVEVQQRVLPTFNGEPKAPVARGTDVPLPSVAGKNPGTTAAEAAQAGRSVTELFAGRGE